MVTGLSQFVMAACKAMAISWGQADEQEQAVSAEAGMLADVVWFH